ncbi:hypothetical protein ACWCQK_37220 [Streptomyces sp. NPDC002306]
MSDDAPTPKAPENAAPQGPAPTGDAGARVSFGKEPADAEPADRISFDKGAAERTPPVRDAIPEAPGTGGVPAAAAPQEVNPWAAPADGPGHTIAAGVASDPAPPSVHDQRTVMAVPGTDNGTGGTPYGAPHNGAYPSGAAAQPWASPFATPNPGGQAGAFPPPHPMTAAGGPAGAPGNPFAPPVHAGGEPVPPPPIAPGGPGQMPYGYPGGYPYPAQPGYGGAHAPGAGAPGYYGWPGMQPLMNNGLGTAGLVLGILSAIVFCLWPIAIVLGVLAVIFGVIGRKRGNRGEASNGGQALAGAICGGVGIALGIGMIFLLFVAS